MPSHVCPSRVTRVPHSQHACSVVSLATMQLNKVMLTRVLVAVAVAVICSSTSVRATAVAPIVTTNLGEVSGFVDDTINCYHGIPVGAPPVGDLRFAPPKPASPWTGVFNGSITPPVCAQIPILHKDVVG